MGRHAGTDSIMVNDANVINLATLEVGDPAAVGSGATTKKTTILVLHGGSEGFYTPSSQPAH